MPRRKFTIPISIVLFLAFVLLGTYFVRKRILERHMITAMELGDEAMVRSPLDSWPYPVNVRNKSRTTPLNWAVKFGSSELVAEMVARGADVNALATRPGRTWVGRRNPAFAIRPLLQSARIGIAPPRRPPVYEVLTPPYVGGSESPLFIAAQNGREDVARLLLAHGAQVDRGRSGGRTPLEAAVSNGHRGLVQMLLKAGANVEGGDRSTGLLYAAVWLGGSDVVRILLDHGADVKKTNVDGQTALHRAVLSRAKTSAELLLGRGASVNARDKKGNTPLHLTAVHGRGDLAELFTAKGADVDARDNDGRTPLHVAALHGRMNFAELLIGKGAEVDPRDERGRTPLHNAASHSRLGFVEILLSKGAQVNARDNAGETPLALARTAEASNEGDHARKKRLIELLRRHGAKE